METRPLPLTIAAEKSARALRVKRRTTAAPLREQRARPKRQLRQEQVRKRQAAIRRLGLLAYQAGLSEADTAYLQWGFSQLAERLPFMISEAEKAISPSADESLWWWYSSNNPLFTACSTFHRF
jgi:hypothetical protein